MGIQKYVPLGFYFLKAIIYLNVEIMRWNLASLIDIKSFIQMIYILFGFSNIPRIRCILFELN